MFVGSDFTSEIELAPMALSGWLKYEKSAHFLKQS
jgi:hypothetical protein